MRQRTNLTFGEKRILNHLEASSCLPHISNYRSHVTNSFRQLQLLPFWLCITKGWFFRQTSFFSLVQTHKPKSVVCIAKEHLILSNPKNLSRRKDQLTRFLNTLKGRSGACYLSTSSFRNGAHRKGLMLYIVILDSKCLFFPLFQGRFVLNLSEKTTPQKASQRKLMRRPEMDFFRSFVGSQALCFDLKLSKGTYIPRQNQACKTSCSLSQELSFTNLKWHGQPFGAAPQAAKVSHVFFFGQTEGFVGSPKKKKVELTVRVKVVLVFFSFPTSLYDFMTENLTLESRFLDILPAWKETGEQPQL